MTHPIMTPDLQHGVVPINKAAGTFATLIAQAKQTQRPIAITQQGRITALLLSIEMLNVLDHVRIPDPDLQYGVVPISKATSRFAGLIDQAYQTSRPIAITQQGRVTALLLSIEVYASAMAAPQQQDLPFEEDPQRDADSFPHAEE